MRGFRLGKVFGIEVRVDWSWVFIFVLLTWNLVTVFSGWHPDWSPLGAMAIAVSAALLFFGCVLLHELAHSVVATSYGLRVRNITLFLFGGVSNIEQEPPSARAEFLMAIVGPFSRVPGDVHPGDGRRGWMGRRGEARTVGDSPGVTGTDQRHDRALQFGPRLSPRRRARAQVHSVEDHG